VADDVGWTALRWPGLEHVIVSVDANGCKADSQLVMAEQGLTSVQYQLSCGPGWRFTKLTIRASSAAADKTLTLAVNAGGHWLADGQPRPDLDDCIDIDINCTPLTNTLPIRRLDWSSAQSHDVDVAYVTVPELGLRRAAQRYTMLTGDRSKAAAFRYESEAFSADLRADSDGFVINYPGIWRRIG
jgi:hypothetical protein